MTIREAEEEGYDRGYRFGQSCKVSLVDRSYCTCIKNKVCKMCLGYAASTSEEHDRQYSPFEFFSHELNSYEDLWNAFDTGIARGIDDATTKRIKGGTL